MYPTDDQNSTILDGSAGGGYNAPSADPALIAELEDLRAYRERSEGFLARLEPHKDRVTRLLEDQDAPRVFDDSYTAYQTIREQQRPKLPPEWNEKENPFLARMAKVADYVDELRTKEQTWAQQQAAESNQRTVSEAYTVAEELIKDLPHLAENNYAGVRAIAAYATSAGKPFKEAADELMPVLRQQKAQASPPRSLRPNQGAPGVPQRSEKTEPDKRSMFEITRDALNKRSNAS